MRKVLAHLGWLAPDDFTDEELNLLFELFTKRQLSNKQSVELVEILRKD